jgi:hypothetical protein
VVHLLYGHKPRPVIHNETPHLSPAGSMDRNPGRVTAPCGRCIGLIPNPADVPSRSPHGAARTPSQASIVETNSVTRLRRLDLEGTPIRSQYVNVPDTSRLSREVYSQAPGTSAVHSQPIHGCGSRAKLRPPRSGHPEIHPNLCQDPPIHPSHLHTASHANTLVPLEATQVECCG